MRSDREYEEDHVEAGRDGALRWVEVGQLRLEEDAEGAVVRIQNPRKPNECGLSAIELAGLRRHLTHWFSDDGGVDAIRQIENCSMYIQSVLTWNTRGRRGGAPPPQDDLPRALDTLLTKCRELRATLLCVDETTSEVP